MFAVIALVAGAAVAFGLFAADGQTSAAATEADASPSTETLQVRRGSLTSEREFTATISHGDPWTINTAAVGTITSTYEAGTVVGFGQALVRVDDQPVTLVRGSMPMYRELFRVNTKLRDPNGNRRTLQTGADVTQLQTFLIAAGYDADGKLEANGVFKFNTEKAVKAWQEATGRSVTGRVDSSQLIFEPDRVRINIPSRVGDSFAGLEVTAPRPQVLVDTSTRDRSALPVGTTVQIDVGDATIAGTVVGQEQVTAGDGTRVWRTTITADREALAATSTATVTVTQVVADEVLLVPVAALLALSEGGLRSKSPTVRARD